MNVYTIGFTQKTAESFFSTIKNAKISNLIDVRLNNVSQLSGFAKRDDLKYFLRELCGVEYVHIPQLSPTKEILDAYKNKSISWSEYKEEFLGIMKQRKIETVVSLELLDNSCFLCSEHEPDYCHRKIVVDYLNEKHGLTFNVKHLC